MSSGKCFVVLGGGIAGLLSAKTLKYKYPDAEIVVIERSRECGGLLAGQRSSCGQYYFDLGTHIFRETGDGEIDSFIQQSIPSGDLLMFDPGYGDLAGSIFNGVLQKNSHFIDIRGLDDVISLRRSLINRAMLGRAPEIDRMAPAVDQAALRFGEKFSQQVLMPLLEAMYQRPRSDLASFAFLLPGLTRAVALDEGDWRVAALDEGIRDIIAVPDQRQLPVSMRSPLRSFYARNGGSSAVVKGICERLTQEGVDFLLGATVDRIDLKGSSIHFTNASGGASQITFDGLVMAVGAVPSARALGVELSQFDFDHPMSHRLVHLVVDEVEDSDLCYFYGLDPSVDFYRVTNYRAISGDQSDRRLTVEVLGEREDSDEMLFRNIESQLRSFNWINGKVIFACGTRLPTGFPAPTVRNLKAISELSDHLADILPQNIILGGIGARRGVFFQNEVIIQTVRAVEERF